MPIIALDMDGTLLNSNKEISPENLAALAEAQGAGCEIVIATGRFSGDAWRILKPYGFRHWLISSNGAMTHSPEGTFSPPPPWTRRMWRRPWPGWTGRAFTSR